MTVLDDRRRPVLGLTAEDFTILEDGRPQHIVGVEEIHLPEPEEPPATWVRDVAPDVRTNDITPEGRLIVILIDDVGLPPVPFAYLKTREIGRAIVEQLVPGDLAAVVYVGNTNHSQDFTTDRGRLVAAVDAVGS